MRLKLAREIWRARRNYSMGWLAWAVSVVLLAPFVVYLWAAELCSRIYARICARRRAK